MNRYYYLILSFLLLFKFTLQQDQRHYRQDFCPAYKEVAEGELSVKNALQGMTITAAIQGTYNKSNPTIQVRVLNEVAKIAGFNVTYVSTPGPAYFETWTDVLVRNTELYDLACDWWERRMFRLELGINFPESWYAADTIMVRKSVPPIEEGFNFWAFTKPFTAWLWVVIVLVVAFTGVVYYVLDFIKSTETGTNTDTNFLGSVFFSFHSFTGHCNYSAKSYASQVLTTSMCFLYLIVVSAYTANLVNFFIAANPPAIVLNDVIDVVRYKLKLCAFRGVPYTEFLKEKYPYVDIIAKENEAEVLFAVSEGRCDVGLTSLEHWKTFKQDKRYNTGCDLEWVGKRVDSVPAGFAVKDSPKTCSSMFNNALNYYILFLKSTGQLDAIWNAHRETIAEKNCKIQVYTQPTKGRTQLKILNMGGAFIFHLFFVFVAISLALYEYYYQPKEIKEQIKGDIMSNFEEVMKSTGLALFDAASSDKGQKMEEDSMEQMRSKSLKVIRELRSKFDEDDLHKFSLQNQLILSQKIEQMTTFIQNNPTLPTDRLKCVTSFFENRFQQQQEEMNELREQVKQLRNLGNYNAKAGLKLD